MTDALTGVEAHREVVGPVVRLRVTLSQLPWRPGPVWAALAGALGADAPLHVGDTLLRLVGAVILADSAWGVLRRVASADGAGDLATSPAYWRLPYAQADAPLGRLRRFVGDAWHEVVAGLIFSAGIGALLGMRAFLVSLAALLVIIGATAWRLRGAQSALANALLDVGLPWALGAVVVLPADAGLPDRQLVPGALLGAAFTALWWGVQRARTPGASHCRMIWLGQALVLACLAGLRQLALVALASVFFLPPAWWLAARRAAWLTTGEALLRSSAWWLAAMLLTAAALWMI
jgi:hypothetical protein